MLYHEYKSRLTPIRVVPNNTFQSWLIHDTARPLVPYKCAFVYFFLRMTLKILSRFPVSIIGSSVGDWLYFCLCVSHRLAGLHRVNTWICRKVLRQQLTEWVMLRGRWKQTHCSSSSSSSSSSWSTLIFIDTCFTMWCSASESNSAKPEPEQKHSIFCLSHNRTLENANRSSSEHTRVKTDMFQKT